MTVIALPRRLLGALDRAVIAAIVVIMAAMVVVVSAQVVLRYGFNASLDWSDDVGRLLFVWSIFLAIPIGIRDGSHIAIAFVVQRFPDPARAAVDRTMAAMMAGMMAVIAWQAGRLCVLQWDEMLPTLEMPVAVFMVPVCIGAAHSVLHLLLIVAGGAPARDPAAGASAE